MQCYFIWGSPPMGKVVVVAAVSVWKQINLPVLLKLIKQNQTNVDTKKKRNRPDTLLRTKTILCLHTCTTR